jgi:hypothetical protein
MVTRITIPNSLIATLNYNEKKVQKKVAACIAAPNFLLDHSKMNFYQKLETFEQRNSLNARAETKTIHISLNFDPSEKLPDQRLTQIASAYMEKMGFGEQPYLVYRHDDAGHPHIHIVSTLIREDRTRIPTHYIGKLLSEPARKAVEEQFGLVKAEQQKQVQRQIKPIDISSTAYGKAETKQSIAEVLRHIVPNYNYTSLPELNAALRQFNVIADPGEAAGFIYQHGGLLYTLVDAEGRKTGVPIKASRFNGKYTLKHLQERFAVNQSIREPFKKIFRVKIDAAFANHPHSLAEFITALRKQQVYTLLRRGKQGNVYGISFVDNENRCVMNGSEIGKTYSIAALQKRLTTTPSIPSASPWISNEQVEYQPQLRLSVTDILEQLLQVQQQNEQTPYPFRMKKRRKKKRT